MKKCKITVSNPGNHFCNPLLKLADAEFASRDEACEAIYAAMYDLIDSEAGCEMVNKADAPKAYWVIAGEGERGTWHRIVATKLGIKQHLTKERCGGDRWAEALCDLYRTVDDQIAGRDVETGAPDFVSADGAEDDIGDANDVRDRYIDICRDYIFKTGGACEDGVAATVEEIDG